ncbi:MAG: hypothetical protein IIU39_01250, partial [Ruminococcus sp.]|nr:hypothetical protein [Ruminococcus sp.]
TTEPQEITEPQETTEPQEITEPQETTEPQEISETKETSETEETTVSDITEPDVITISYLPSDEQELNGYNYWLFFRDKNGNEESVQMVPTGDKMNGKDIYGAVLPADKEYTEMYIQILYGETWESQIQIDPEIAKKSIIDSYGNPVVIGPDTQETTDSEDLPTEPEPTYAPLPANDIRNIPVPAIKAMTYTGKALTPKVVLFDAENNYTLVEDTDYILSYKDNVNAGTATVIITAVGDFEGSITKTFSITKAKNPIKVTAKKTVKAKAKKKTVIKKAVKIKKAKGKVTCKTNNKKIKVNKKGTMTVAKGLKKGKTYKVKVKVTAKGNSNYKKKTVSKTVKVKVK